MHHHPGFDQVFHRISSDEVGSLFLVAALSRLGLSCLITWRDIPLPASQGRQLCKTLISCSKHSTILRRTHNRALLNPCIPALASNGEVVFVFSVLTARASSSLGNPRGFTEHSSLRPVLHGRVTIPFSNQHAERYSYSANTA